MPEDKADEIKVLVFRPSHALVMGAKCPRCNQDTHFRFSTDAIETLCPECGAVIDLKELAKT